MGDELLHFHQLHYVNAPQHGAWGTQSHLPPGVGAPVPGLMGAGRGGSTHQMGDRRRQQALDRQWKMGFVYTCRHDTLRENFDHGVFGLPVNKMDLLREVEPHNCALFLFDRYGLSLACGMSCGMACVWYGLRVVWPACGMSQLALGACLFELLYLSRYADWLAASRAIGLLF